MKKFIALFLALVMVLGIAACGGNTETTTANALETTTEAPTETTTSAPAETTTEAPAETTTGKPDPATCEHTYEETIITPADYQNEGEKSLTCSLCGDSKNEVIPVDRSIKILAIGNSFSDDATEYLWKIFENAGFEDIIIGNLYIGGCSLDTHWDNIEFNLPNYTYYLHEFGFKDTKKNYRLQKALESEDWDIITVQQVSQNSGMPETFNNLQNILDFVNETKTNKDAKIYWHMTWAYQQNSTHSGFANYDKDQMTMYNAIINGTQNTILKNEDITDSIPSGTTIQNLRTSYLGDTLTRDGYHMSYGIGRYAVALTWFAKLTGLPVDNIDYLPKEYASVIEKALPAIKESVTEAVKTPFAVTKSTQQPAEVVIKTVDMTDADRARLTKLGYDPEKYLVLDLEPAVACYYNSSSSSALVTKENSSATNIPFFGASVIIPKENIPNGSLITVDSGYQYRPEGWVTLASKNSSRPENVTTECVVTDNAWWDAYQFRAFNLSYIGSKTNMTTSDLDHLRVYIPKA